MTKPHRSFGADKSIPYVAMWSSETWSEIRYDPLVKMPAIFSAGGQGIGKPVLGKMNEARQRECVRLGRCQVCHAITKQSPFFAADTVVREIEGYGNGYLITEPPVCRSCFVLTLRHCVGLRRQIEEETIVAGILYRQTQVIQGLTPNHPDFVGLEGNDGVTPFAGYLRYIPTSFKLLTMSQIREMAA